MHCEGLEKQANERHQMRGGAYHDSPYKRRVRKSMQTLLTTINASQDIMNNSSNDSEAQLNPGGSSLHSAGTQMGLKFVRILRLLCELGAMKRHAGVHFLPSTPIN
jgi:hypothetical protein